MKRRQAEVKRCSRRSVVHSIVTSSRRVAGIAGNRTKSLLKIQSPAEHAILGFAQSIVPQNRSDFAPKPLASLGNPIFGFQIFPISAETIAFASKIRRFLKNPRTFAPKSVLSGGTPAFLLPKAVVSGGFAAFPPTYWPYPQAITLERAVGPQMNADERRSGTGYETQRAHLTGDPCFRSLICVHLRPSAVSLFSTAGFGITDRHGVLGRMMAKENQATDQSRTRNLNPAVEVAAKRGKRPSTAQPQPNDLATKDRIDRKDSWFSLLCSLCSLAAKKILSKLLACREEVVDGHKEARRDTKRAGSLCAFLRLFVANPRLRLRCVPLCGQSNCGI